LTHSSYTRGTCSFGSTKRQRSGSRRRSRPRHIAWRHGVPSTEASASPGAPAADEAWTHGRGSSPEAMEACMAMKPDCRPISFTSPMPLCALLASTLAAISARCASSTAVSNPKQRSTCAWPATPARQLDATNGWELTVLEAGRVLGSPRGPERAGADALSMRSAAAWLCICCPSGAMRNQWVAVAGWHGGSRPARDPSSPRAATATTSF
jgi:hypothetical protein